MEKKSESERISYARKVLLDLVEKRELRAWCMERDLPHSSIYKVAVGTDIPSYILICQMLPYFSPAEWVYFTDEEIPYKHEPLPVFNPKEFSLFIKKHKIDYMDIAEKLGLTEANAKNIFLHRRANLSLLHIRKLAAEVNPEEFFVPADESVDGFFYPDRGDIVSLSGKNILVLSKTKDNSQNACFIGAVLDSESDGAVHVKGETVEGYVSVRNMSSFTYARRNPVLVDKAEDETVSSVLKMVKRLFA